MYIEDIRCMQILYSINLQSVVESNMLTYIDKGIFGESVTSHKFLNVGLCVQEVSPATSHHVDMSLVFVTVGLDSLSVLKPVIREREIDR